MNLTEIFLNKLKIETKQVPIDSLFNDEGELNKTQYNPPYQRNYVWDAEKATYFLESILIGTEIPPLIFFKSGLKQEIIDGRQRYETILRFLRNELKLKKSGLKKLDLLNIAKKTFSDLSDDMQNDFLETKLRVIEFSFASHDGITPADEESVKQEIFKRYNSGITPLKEAEIDKAIYFEDDLNAFFKERLKEKEFHELFTTLFKYEDKEVEVSLKKIRQLLVLHKIPIKYYSAAKQKVTDKYYALLSSQLKVEDIDEFFESFKQKLVLINVVRESLEFENLPYNRLVSEVLFWTFSVLEENDINLPEKESIAISGFADIISNNINVFKMDRSSFSNEIVTRYRIMADYMEKMYQIDTYSYIATDREFIKKNREINQPQNPHLVNYQELRINKPEPSTNTINDICRQMNRNRFLVRPAYQREEVINRKKSSEIIESILLGIKLPPIFVFKNEDGVCEVIDGQQRILSILAFIGKEYMDESGKLVKTKKDRFSLLLKDSILTELNGKKFEQLTAIEQDKITSFGLWVIEINHKYNPNFESLDLFIRLNNKPYPIKDDTFEMWNSYIDRGLVDAIKTSYSNNANWFFLRKTGNRMENENNYTVLSYFNYLDLNPQEGSEKGPIDIYKAGGRIAFRLRSKRDISAILENAAKKDAFIEAVNNFEFSFVANLKVLLTDDKDDSDKILSKNLDELLGGMENVKRTQQSFYVLWHFLKNLDPKSLVSDNKQIRLKVRQLFEAMSLDTSVEDFKSQVESFRNPYILVEKEKLLRCRLGDVAVISSCDIEASTDNDCMEFYLKRDNKTCRRIQIAFEKPKNVEDYWGIRTKREGVLSGYLAAILQSSIIFSENGFDDKRLQVNYLKNCVVPLVSREKQWIFERLMGYIQTTNHVQRMFFESVLDKLTEEVFCSDLFEFQNVTLFNKVNKLDDLKGLCEEERITYIDKVYNAIIKEDEGLFSELSAASGITGSYNEKDL